MELYLDPHIKKQLLYFLPPHLQQSYSKASTTTDILNMYHLLKPYIERLTLVEKNLSEAENDIPESFFGIKLMLYVPITINGHYYEAFIDSGAQMSVMNMEVATDAGLVEYIDPRFATIARGVGTQKILGKLHKVDMTIGEHFLSWTFQIIDGNNTPLILGLDFLTTYRAKIDLDKKCLTLNSIDIPFLTSIHVIDQDDKKLKQEELFDKELIGALDEVDETHELNNAIKLSITEQSSSGNVKLDDEYTDEELAIALSMSMN